MNPTMCVLVRKSKIDKTLLVKPESGKRSLEPFRTFAKTNELPFQILEDTAVDSIAEVHGHEADLWLCLEGEVTFTFGGELVDGYLKKNPDGSVNKREWQAKEIKGGTTEILRPGDWLWIPAGEPHKHACAGTARLVIIKIPQATS